MRSTFLALACFSLASACSQAVSNYSSSEAAVAGKSITFDAFYQAVKTVTPSQRSAAISAMRSSTFSGLARQLLQVVPTTPAVIGDVQLSNVRNRLTANLQTFGAMDQAFGTIGGYWHAVGYEPEAAIPAEATLISQLHSLNSQSGNSGFALADEQIPADQVAAGDRVNDQRFMAYWTARRICPTPELAAKIVDRTECNNLPPISLGVDPIFGFLNPGVSYADDSFGPDHITVTGSGSENLLNAVSPFRQVAGASLNGMAAGGAGGY